MKTNLFVGLLAATVTSALAATEGLKIEVTSPVECDRKTQKGDNVAMHYRDTRRLGWDQGLLDMCIGEKRTLTISPDLAYGQRAMGPIPAGSTLVFETELVSIEGVPKPDNIQYKSVSSEGVAAKVASAVFGAVDAGMSFIADTDDVQGHEEL